jgi:hypothetical protein
VAGQWSVQGLAPQGSAVLRLSQRHQRLGGTVAWGGQTQNLLGASLNGVDLYFSFVQADGQLKAVQARVQGASMQGEVVGPYGMGDFQPEVVKVTGQRLGD